MILKSSLGSNYTVTTSYADIPGLKITIPEDGIYFLTGSINGLVKDTDATGAQLYAKVAINSTQIVASGGYLNHNDAANNYLVIGCIPISNILYLKKGDTITVQAVMGAGQNCIVYASTAGTGGASYINAVNLTKLAKGMI